MARRNDRWAAHPVLAWWVRLTVLLVPLVVSVLVALLVIALLPDPSGFWGHAGWWALVLGAAFVSAQLVDRLARRALPLAVLLRLSLVFPDRAPSRLAAARRTSLREMEAQVAALHASGNTTEPAQAARTLVSLVGALGLHDKRTRGHSERVRAYVDMLTEELGLPEEDRTRLRWSALIHDIGKLSVPALVLNGTSDLEAAEWAALHKHPDEGERIASGLMPWLGEWGQCVRQHHERWDGRGYPRGLAGEQISLGARIVAVADAYEVMTANRSYQKAISPAAAREELSRCAGTDFDPAVVRAFLQISIGRLRGVLGPLALLPALPFAVAADRAGQAARGMTTVAASAAVAATLVGSPAPHRPPPALGAGTPVVTLTPPPAASPMPSPTPSPTPSSVAVPAPVRRSPAPRPTPTTPQPPVPAAAVPVLFLDVGGALSPTLHGSGAVTVASSASAAPFGMQLATDQRIDGAPVLVLFQRLLTAHGQGRPKAFVTATLLDCSSTCRTVTMGSAVLLRGSDWVEQRITLNRLSTIVPAGHELRLAIALTGRTNVTGIQVGYGSTPSRLLLP